MGDDPHVAAHHPHPDPRPERRVSVGRGVAPSRPSRRPQLARPQAPDHLPRYRTRHIRKYTKQDHKIIRETPQLYQQVVVPYINAIPPTRLSWLYNILDHVTEADKIVYEDPSDTDGFMIMPDLKWDQSTRSSLYLLCIVRNRGIRSLRDLRPRHLGMLQTIRARAAAAIEQKYQVSGRELRMFVHYQPSYYHFHVHITHVDHLGFNGIAVGQAHLLDDVIDNLAQELRRASSGPSLYEAKTFTYALGSHHALFEPLWARQLPDF